MTDLAELEGLAKAATPGEWLNTGAKTVDDEWMVTGGEGESYGLIGCVLTEEDAAYIAAANPQAVLALIAENRAYREALESIELCSCVDSEEERIARAALTLFPVEAGDVGWRVSAQELHYLYALMCAGGIVHNAAAVARSGKNLDLLPDALDRAAAILDEGLNGKPAAASPPLAEGEASARKATPPAGSTQIGEG